MKEKKFERKLARPSLAASLEAVRQGKPLVQEKATPMQPVVVPVESVSKRTSKGLEEARYVKAEVARIAVIMGALLALLIILAFIESRAGFLTGTLEGFLSR